MASMIDRNWREHTPEWKARRLKELKDKNRYTNLDIPAQNVIACTGMTGALCMPGTIGQLDIRNMTNLFGRNEILFLYVNDVGENAIRHLQLPLNVVLRVDNRVPDGIGYMGNPVPIAQLCYTDGRWYK